MLTGDNELVTAEVCRQVGLTVQGVVMGAAIDKMDDQALGLAVGRSPTLRRNIRTTPA